jgi:uncharacterized protein YcfJ
MAIYSREFFMNMTATSKRIHPLLAVAAVSVTLLSLVGIAAITGVLPKSHGAVADGSSDAGTLASVPTTPNSGVNETVRSKPVAHQNAHAAGESAAQSTSAAAHPSAAPAAPVAQNSAVGIGVGAVVGGVLGHQVGGGNGKTLATIAGAVGGAYVGNEVAKKNQ